MMLDGAGGVLHESNAVLITPQLLAAASSELERGPLGALRGGACRLGVLLERDHDFVSRHAIRALGGHNGTRELKGALVE